MPAASPFWRDELSDRLMIPGYELQMRILKQEGYVAELRVNAEGWRTVVRVNSRGEPMEWTEKPCYSPGKTGEHPLVMESDAKLSPEIKALRAGMPLTNSLTVWDDEAQRQKGQDITPMFSEELLGIAHRKGMPAEAKFFTRRNDSGNGTIFEWE